MLLKLILLHPDHDGSLTVYMKAAPGSSHSYINALVITKDDRYQYSHPPLREIYLLSMRMV